MERELAELDPGILGGVARSALQSQAAEIVSWACEPLSYASTPMVALWSDGVYRVTGTTTDAGQERSWSAVLKTYHSPAGRTVPNGEVVSKQHADDQASSHYWRREPIAYASGLLEDLPGGIAAPRCLGITELPNEHCWVWLEEVRDTADGGWPLERYGLAAAHLGQFNGAYLGARQLPEFPWLSRQRLRGFMTYPLEPILGHIRSIDGAWEHPVVREAFAAEVVDRVMRLWEEREMFLSALDRLPQVLSHLDAFKGNLFGRLHTDGVEQTVAIDWGFMGVAPLGDEVAPLIVGSVLTDHVPMDDLPRLEETVLDGYDRGLREAGWAGRRDLVEASYATCAALRYGLITPLEIVLAAHNEGLRAAMTGNGALSFEVLARRRAALTVHLMDGLDRARQPLGVA